MTALEYDRMPGRSAYMPQAKTVEWETPQAFYDRLDAEFNFLVDAAATKENAKCAEYFSIAMFNAFDHHWASDGAVFCNPPYGRVLRRWVALAYEESQLNPHPIVMLLPARTDTKWWHEYVMRADEIRFVKGRLKFGGATNSATFPSVVVVFRSAKVDGFKARGIYPYISSMQR